MGVGWVNRGGRGERTDKADLTVDWVSPGVE